MLQNKLGAYMLSISPFLVIDDNPIKAYKKIFNKAFEFSDLVRAPPQYVHMNGIQLKIGLTCQNTHIEHK